MKRIPTPSLVISLIALFVALGGTSYAAITALPKDSVGTKQLKNNAVTSAKIASGAVTAAKINTSGLTVPSATHAASADSATNATSATTAANATELGGQLPSFYLPASVVQAFGPITVPACTTASCVDSALITVGKFRFDETCQNFGGFENVTLELTNLSDHASWADTDSISSTPSSNPDMGGAGGIEEIANQTLAAGTPTFVSVNGEALSGDGHVVSFNLYMGQNA
jgi:hypothetical protein